MKYLSVEVTSIHIPKRFTESPVTSSQSRGVGESVSKRDKGATYTEVHFKVSF